MSAKTDLATAIAALHSGGAENASGLLRNHPADATVSAMTTVTTSIAAQVSSLQAALVAAGVDAGFVAAKLAMIATLGNAFDLLSIAQQQYDLLP